MRAVRVLTGVAALIVASGLFVVGCSGEGPPPVTAETKPSAAPATAPATSPTPTASPTPAAQPAAAATAIEVACKPAPDVERLQLRAEPSAQAPVIDTPGAASLVRFDARSTEGGRDWIRVGAGDRTGWVDGRTVRCPFTPAQAKAIAAGEVDRVLDALAARDMAALATLVHPVKGLRLSPTVDIDPKESVVLRAPGLAAAFDDQRARRRWGAEDGSGDPIVISFRRYYERFVYDRDYRGKAERSFNEFGRKSTTRPYVREVYPHAIVVECHVPGTKPESEGQDWASLLLVFEQHDGRWYLSALVHDQWSV
jgi:hypothetical protein